MFKKRKSIKKIQKKVKNWSKEKGCQNDDHNKIINFKNEKVTCVCQPKEEKDKDE